MSWTLCVSGLPVNRAGANANSTIVISGLGLAEFSDAVEGRICAEGHTDFVTNFAGFDGQIQNALSDVASSWIAMDIIAYDTSGYLTREADTLMNLNDDRASKGMAIIKNKVNQKLT